MSPSSAFALASLKFAITAQLRISGFDAASDQSLSVLSDVAVEYLLVLGRGVKSVAAGAGRTGANLLDVGALEMVDSGGIFFTYMAMPYFFFIGLRFIQI